MRCGPASSAARRRPRRDATREPGVATDTRAEVGVGPGRPFALVASSRDMRDAARCGARHVAPQAHGEAMPAFTCRRTLRNSALLALLALPLCAACQSDCPRGQVEDGDGCAPLRARASDTASQGSSGSLSSPGGLAPLASAGVGVSANANNVIFVNLPGAGIAAVGSTGAAAAAGLQPPAAGALGLPRAGVPAARSGGPASVPIAGMLGRTAGMPGAGSAGMTSAAGAGAGRGGAGMMSAPMGRRMSPAHGKLRGGHDHLSRRWRWLLSAQHHHPG